MDCACSKNKLGNNSLMIGSELLLVFPDTGDTPFCAQPHQSQTTLSSKNSNGENILKTLHSFTSPLPSLSNWAPSRTIIPYPLVSSAPVNFPERDCFREILLLAKILAFLLTEADKSAEACLEGIERWLYFPAGGEGKHSRLVSQGLFVSLPPPQSLGLI